MKKLFLISIAALALVACSSVTPAQESQIKTACATDAIIRPSVTALLEAPGLATIEQKSAVLAARAIIDPICANPSVPVQDQVAQGLAAAVGQVVVIYTELKTKKAPQ